MDVVKNHDVQTVLDFLSQALRIELEAEDWAERRLKRALIDWADFAQEGWGGDSDDLLEELKNLLGFKEPCSFVFEGELHVSRGTGPLSTELPALYFEGASYVQILNTFERVLHSLSPSEFWWPFVRGVADQFVLAPFQSSEVSATLESVMFLGPWLPTGATVVEQTIIGPFESQKSFRRKNSKTRDSAILGAEV